MWLSPKFKYDALRWLNDELLKNRDNSGESFKKLASAIQNSNEVGIARAGIVIPQVAKTIKNKLKVDDWNKTNEDVLKLRDEIHKHLTMLIKAGVKIDKALNIVFSEMEKNDD